LITLSVSIRITCSMMTENRRSMILFKTNWTNSFMRFNHELSDCSWATHGRHWLYCIITIWARKWRTCQWNDYNALWCSL